MIMKKSEKKEEIQDKITMTERSKNKGKNKNIKYRPAWLPPLITLRAGTGIITSLTSKKLHIKDQVKFTQQIYIFREQFCPLTVTTN